MIDDDKIVKAASELCDYGSIHDSEYRIEGFKKCAKWMQEEFLKDLWHPTNEEPREFAEVLAEAKITESIKTYISFKRNDALFKIGMLIVRVLILLVGCILMIYCQRKEVSNE
jgi:hypothetical protein